MSETPAIIYLHGLGSSPQSPKAKLFSDHFSMRGYAINAPDVSQPSLPLLSVDVALELVRSVIAREAVNRPVVLVGNSLGGFLAVHALRHLAVEVLGRVAGIVLLAPVLYPWHALLPIIPGGIEDEWLRKGFYSVEDAATGAMVPVHRRFIEELRQWATEKPRIHVPTLILHGLRDEQVPHQHSVEFVEDNPSARLVSLNDDHLLMAEPSRLVACVEDFILTL